MILPKFAEFETIDGLTLPGLLYRPSGSKSVIIYLHGNGSSSVFYNEMEKRLSAEVFAKKKISLFTFNNRGAHIIKKINIKIGKNETERRKFGMTYEIIKDCVIDIDSAIKFLRKEGFNKFYLMGLSTGANKICVYDHYKKENPVSKYVILGGGDDTGIYFDILGKLTFFKLLDKSRQMLKIGKGDEIITNRKLFPDSILSYKAFFDIANPDGDYNCFPFLEVLKQIKLSKKPLFRYFKNIKKPTLVVYGENDEYAWGDVSKIVEILKKYRTDIDYQIIKNADHGFTGYRDELAKLILNWI